MRNIQATLVGKSVRRNHLVVAVLHKNDFWEKERAQLRLVALAPETSQAQSDKGIVYQFNDEDMKSLLSMAEQEALSTAMQIDAERIPDYQKHDWPVVPVSKVHVPPPNEDESVERLKFPFDDAVFSGVMRLSNRSSLNDGDKPSFDDKIESILDNSPWKRGLACHWEHHMSYIDWNNKELVLPMHPGASAAKKASELFGLEHDKTMLFMGAMRNITPIKEGFEYWESGEELSSDDLFFWMKHSGMFAELSLTDNGPVVSALLYEVDDLLVKAPPGIANGCARHG